MMPTCSTCGEKFGLSDLREGKCKTCRTKESYLGAGGVARCKECGLPTDIDELLAGDGKCIYCRPSSSKSSDAIKADADKLLALAADKVTLTTGFDIPGRETAEIVKIVATEAALGMNIFKDIANNWRDTFGGRSGSVQNLLKDAREACLQDLKMEAARAGAEAVIAVRLNYSEASTSAGSGGGILFVAASGTAVNLK